MKLNRSTASPNVAQRSDNSVLLAVFSGCDVGGLAVNLTRKTRRHPTT
jgi:hypothetical protein